MQRRRQDREKYIIFCFEIFTQSEMGETGFYFPYISHPHRIPPVSVFLMIQDVSKCTTLPQHPTPSSCLQSTVVVQMTDRSSLDAAPLLLSSSACSNTNPAASWCLCYHCITFIPELCNTVQYSLTKLNKANRTEYTTSRSITKRLTNSFHSHAIRLLNNTITPTACRHTTH